MSSIFVIVGEIEEVGQSRIGGPFETTYLKEVVGYATSLEDAKKYIESQKLKKVKKKTYSGASYYEGGYYDMEIEEIFEV